jgi:hypothetical protein
LTCRRDMPKRSAICCWVSPSALNRRRSPSADDRVPRPCSRAPGVATPQPRPVAIRCAAEPYCLPQWPATIPSHSEFCNLISETAH